MNKYMLLLFSICLPLFPYLSIVYYELSRGQDCVLASGFIEEITTFLPGQAGLRDPFGQTYQLCLTVFHHYDLLLSTTYGRWDCKSRV